MHEARKPRVVVLCGSSRFPEAFDIANLHYSMRGDIVIGLCCYGHADRPIGARFLTSDASENSLNKQGFDELHFRKIDLCDAIVVVNVGDYIGSSTKREIEYARLHGKDIEYMFAHDTAGGNETLLEGMTETS